MFHLRYKTGTKMDEKDRKIIEILQQQGDLTTRQIAKKTLLPVTTIHNRVKKLKEEKIIKRFTIDVDHNKLDQGFLAIILVSVDYKALRDLKKDQHYLADELKKIHEVEHVFVVTGGTDMVVHARVKDVQAFDQFLLKKFQAIPGVDKTQSLVVIHEI